MSYAQTVASRLYWLTRERFRYRRWSFWHGRAGKEDRARNLYRRAKWWKLYTEAHEKRVLRDKQLAKMKPPKPKEGLSIFDGHEVANWIVPILTWARARGWTGTVVSGYRSPAHQMEAAIRFCREIGKTLAEEYPSGPLASNHVGFIYPRGAVDVTEYAQLARVLRGYAGSPKLLWAAPTIGDVVHFSANAH